MEEKLLSEYELRNLGEETYKNMDEETKKLVNNIMFSTIDLINSYNPDNPIFFYEDVAWRLFRWEMLGHMKNKEGWHVEDKHWIKLKE